MAHLNIIILCILSLLFGSSALAQQRKTSLFTHNELQWIKDNPSITLGVDPAWAPFEFIDEHGRYSGMASDFIHIISNKTGLSINIQHNPTWQDVINSAKADQLDVLPAVMESEERKQYLDFTAPHMTYPMVILTRKNSPFISSMDDLEGQKVVVVEGYVTEDILRRNHPQINLLTAKTIEAALDILSSGDAHALIDNLASITHSISQRGNTNLRISGTTPYQFRLGLGIPKGHTLLLNILQKAIASITEQDKKIIRDKWIGMGFTRDIDYSTTIQAGSVLLFFIIMVLFWNRKLSGEVKLRKKSEKELRINEQRFRDLFEKNKAIELIIDPASKKIIDANKAALEYYGYSKREILQLKISDINTSTDAEIFNEAQQARKERRSHLFYKHQLANKEIRHVEVHSGPITWDKQELLHSIIHDITDRVKAEKALIDAKQEAEQATLSKSKFLANMSHEIRTPMNAVLGMAELLEETPLNAEQKKMLSIVQSSGKHLLSTINDILDFSKLEADKMPVETLSVQLLPLVDEVIDIFKGSAVTKDIKLTTDYADDCDVNVRCDPTKLRQILTNLISNAIKFTQAGSVSVSVSQSQARQNQAVFELQIIDTGIGIRKEIKQGLFDSFTQAEQSTTRKYGGTGLGLAITKKLVDLLDGVIHIQSSPGQGSTFIVQLPMRYLPLSEQDLNLRKQGLNKKNKPRPQFNARVLIAEDVLPNRILIEKMINKFGLESMFAENGQQVVDMIQQQNYDLVLMDCHMPVMDGYTATQKIRQFNADIPILALTANASPEDRQKALDSGMNEVLIKPLQMPVLEQALGHWLNHKISRYITIMHNDQPDTHLAAINYYTLGTLRTSMEDDFTEVFEAIFSSIDSLIDELSELPENSETVTRLFHSIKSPASSLGAEQLADLAARYEQQSRQGDIGDLNNLVKGLQTNFQAIKDELSEFKMYPAS